MATKKQMGKKCSVVKCNNQAEMGSFCAKHAAENDATERVNKLSELDAAKYGKLDAEIRVCLQGMRLADYDVEQIRNTANAQIATQMAHKAKLQIQVNNLKNEYDPLVARIAKQFGIKDPKQMTIDTDSGIVRDLAMPDPEESN